MKNNDYLELSGLELAMMEFPEERFIIQDIVPKGLVILSSEMAAPARSLAMDMCLRVVMGDKLWKMDTRQGAVHDPPAHAGYNSKPDYRYDGADTGRSVCGCHGRKLSGTGIDRHKDFRAGSQQCCYGGYSSHGSPSVEH